MREEAGAALSFETGKPEAENISRQKKTDYDYEVTVIGGGPGGYVAAIKAAQAGKKTCIVESTHFGGTCLNEGCIPTKALVKSASVLDEVRKAATFGIMVNQDSVRIDSKAVFDRKQQVVKTLVGGIQTDALNAGGIGIEYDRRAIKVNEYLQTNIPNIYCIGDANGKVMLAHTASHEGITAVENICGSRHKVDYTKIPSCIYLEPEISSIGLTEAQAREKYKDIRVDKFPMIANGKS